MDAYKADLLALKNEGGSASATIDLGRPRRFVAWGSVSMVDPLNDFDRDNAFAFDIFSVDGQRTTWRVSGGEHWGPAGSSGNVYDGGYVGFGRRITFWLRTIHSADLDTFGSGIVLALD